VTLQHRLDFYHDRPTKYRSFSFSFYFSFYFRYDQVDRFGRDGEGDGGQRYDQVDRFGRGGQRGRFDDMHHDSSSSVFLNQLNQQQQMRYVGNQQQQMQYVGMQPMQQMQYVGNQQQQVRVEEAAVLPVAQTKTPSSSKRKAVAAASLELEPIQTRSATAAAVEKKNNNNKKKKRRKR
jgi:hypothetical protein